MASTALFLLVVFPFAGAAIAPLLKDYGRAWALLVSFLAFACAIVVAVSIQGGPAINWGYEPNNPIVFRDAGFGMRLRCDNISAWLAIMTAGLFPLVILSTSNKIDSASNGRFYYAWMLVLLGAILGALVAGDGLLFYFFFELTLVPSLLLIGGWGGPHRMRAAAKFFIYTFAGSIFLLIGLIYLAAKVPGGMSFEISDLVKTAQHVVSPTERYWLALAFLVGFLIKTPVFPLHTWQALTYSESPQTVASILSAVLSKLGTYGLLRLTLPIGFVGAGNVGIEHTVEVLCLISIIYGGLIAWVQKDMARVLAFSSLSHLALCVLALFGLQTLSMQGAMAYMLAHGLSTTALFLIVSAIQDRTGTRDITQISGLFAKMPVLGTLLVLFTMASIGLPITSGFVGEFLSLQGVDISLGLGVTAVAATGMILAAIYMLNMVAKVGFGPLTAPEGADLRDLSGRELTALLPIAVAVFALGIGSAPVLDSFKKDIASIWNPAAPSSDVAMVDLGSKK